MKFVYTNDYLRYSRSALLQPAVWNIDILSASTLGQMTTVRTSYLMAAPSTTVCVDEIQFEVAQDVLVFNERPTFKVRTKSHGLILPQNILESQLLT